MTFIPVDNLALEYTLVNAICAACYTSHPLKEVRNINNYIIVLPQ